MDQNSRRSVRGRSAWVLLLFPYDLVHLSSVVTPGATIIDLVATEPVRPGADALTTGEHEDLRPGSVPQRGGDAARVLASYRGRSRASTRSRSWSSTTARPTAPSRSPASSACACRAAHPQHGSGPVVPRRGRLRAGPRGGHRGEHRRRQPVPAGRIPDLVRPIVEGAADIVIGDRQTAKIAHFSPFKKLMQRVGSRVVNRAARNGPAGRGERVPGVLAGVADAAEHRHRIQLLHGDDHPGRQPPAADRERPGRHQPEDPRVAAVQEHLPPHVQVGRRRSSAAT